MIWKYQTLFLKIAFVIAVIACRDFVSLVGLFTLIISSLDLLGVGGKSGKIKKFQVQESLVPKLKYCGRSQRKMVSSPNTW